MALDLPVVGVTPDPVWGTKLNAALTDLDGRASDATVAGYVSAGGPTETALNATYAPGGTAGTAPVSATNEPAALAATAYVPLSTPVLPRFRKKLALTRLGQSPTRVLCIGDSTTAGVYSDSYTTATGSTNQGGPNSYPAQLANRLNAAGLPAFYNLAIPGHTGNLDSRWTLIGKTYATAVGAGNNSGFALYSSGDGLSILPGVKADTYKIYFAANSGTGTMTAQATGGALSAAFGSNPTAGTYSITVTAGSASAANTVTINWVSGTAFVVGVEWYDSTAPNRLTIANAGVGASKATTWASDLTGYAKAPTWMKAFAPDLTIISLGINDISEGDTPANVLAAISSLITVAQTTGDVLLMSAFPHPTATALDTVNESLRTAQGVPALPYVDLFQRYGHNMQSQGFQTTDGVHPNALGYSDTASAIANLILSL
jgi:lysophospholipase L1-like esterase